MAAIFAPTIGPGEVVHLVHIGSCNDRGRQREADLGIMPFPTTQSFEKHLIQEQSLSHAGLLFKLFQREPDGGGNRKGCLIGKSMRKRVQPLIFRNLPSTQYPEGLNAKYLVIKESDSKCHYKNIRKPWPLRPNNQISGPSGAYTILP